VNIIGPGGDTIGGAATDIEGKFTTQPLRPGAYSVIVQAQGFRPAKANNIMITNDSNIVLLCTLAYASETICFGDPPPMIDAKSASSGAVISEGSNGQIYVDPH
jgi:hypothetical protein